MSQVKRRASSRARTCTPTNLDTLPSSVFMGVIVSRFQNGVPSRL